MERQDFGAAIAYAGSGLLVAGSTAIALLGREAFHLPDVVMLYLLAILIAAFRLGRGPAVAAAALSVGSYDFFFVPPFFRLSVEAARHILTFAMMFGLGLVVSGLTARLRQEEREARAREAHTSVLHELSRELVGVDDAKQAAQVAARHASQVFGCEAIIHLLAPSDASGTLPDEWGVPLAPQELEVARWVMEHAMIAGAGTEIHPGAHVAGVPLTAGLEPLGALLLRKPDPRVMDGSHRSFLEIFARQISLAIERVRLAEAARRATLQARAEQMRSSLLSAVSHDLRTPLATITGAGTALRDEQSRLTPAQRAEFVQTICVEAERMERLIGNILDMVRIESGGMQLRRDWIPLEEVLGSALVRLDAQLAGREVKADLPAELPLVFLDPVLFEQVFVNLLDNAVKYTPPGSPILIEARSVDGVVEMEVADRGPGIPPGEEERIFEKFRRGGQDRGGGVGLGLAICRGIVEIHGGTITAGNREGGGVVFRIRLPIREAPPMVVPADSGEVTA